MKQKKSLIIIVVSVIAVCVLGVIASKVFNWPVNGDLTSGNVAKSSRFSRKTTTEDSNNMQELLLNDEGYKNGIVAAYLVMKTRAQQFDALVDMSNEVAGGIKEFASVLKDMKAAQPMIANVCESMDVAGKDLNTALGGESAQNLAQSTTNAALAYKTLQKQNGLATRFIDTADAYLAKAAGDDRLKFVRDQWVEYQQLTALLEKDEKAAAELEAKGHLLNADQSVAALASFSVDDQVISMCSGTVSEVLGLQSPALHASDVTFYGNLNATVQNDVLGINAQSDVVGGDALGISAQSDVIGGDALGISAQSDVIGGDALGISAQSDVVGGDVLGISAQNDVLGATPFNIFLSAFGELSNIIGLVNTSEVFNANATIDGTLSNTLGNTIHNTIQNVATGDVINALAK